APPMGGVLPYGQEEGPRPTRPMAGQGPRGPSSQATTTLTPGACDILELEEFDEDDLYHNLDWLAEHQEQIEDRVFHRRYGTQKPDLYLYDVTSSYLQGVCNALAAFGYSRDGKAGKMQIVYGLLCDFEGVPVSIQAFPGNTSDTKTFGAQVHKVTQRFGGGAVTFVGDRGMIKGPQIQQLQAEQEHEFHYITAITKSQVEALLKRGLIQMTLFDETVAEVLDGDVRYVLRRNPERADAIAAGRQSKLASLQKLVEAKNTYLAEHPRASVAAAQREIETREKTLRLPDVVLTLIERTFSVSPQAEAWAEAAKLDGCYCLKTDVLAHQASKETIHDRYKDLAQVEWAFRTSKTGLLEARPFFVRLEKRTRGHLLVVMLAYLLVQELASCWHDLELTVEEGLGELKSLCTTRVTVKGQPVL
ncbi:MAG: IS1634 family transposase, partial [Acidobacteriota bacterium]